MDKKMFLSLIILCVFLVLSGIILVNNIDSDIKLVENNVGIYNEKKEKNNEVPRAVMVDGELYVDSCKIIEILRCGVPDGMIEYQVERNSMPTKNNESNFCVNIGYQRVDDNNIDLRLEEGWIRFTKL